MPFDPNYPINNSQLTATELRAQLNALNDLITALTLRVAALEPRTATGFGDPPACGQYLKADMWNGYPLYLNAAGYCLVYDGNTGWVIWNGDVRVGGAISSQYNKPGTDPTGPYGLSNGTPPAGAVS